MCYYFNDIINGINISLSDILLDKKNLNLNYMKIFQFIASHTKLECVQNHCVLGSIK